MIELNVEPGPSERFVFLEESHITKGETSPPLNLEGASVDIATPGILPLTEALVADDKELKAFWEGEKGRYCYHYLVFRCSFRPTAGQPFVKAWFEVRLEGGENDEPPLAWSMEPREVFDTSKLIEKATVGSEFKLLSSEVEVNEEQTHKQWFLQAYREGKPNPYWEFRRTDQSPIDGSYRLKLIVRSPATLYAGGEIMLRAVVESRTFRIFRRESDLPGPEPIKFTLPI